ncbi:glycosyltransferase family 4 protein [Burkholderia ubonensis]|uniref:glycosyltransferase family 4 protein n=1 Tax=Burkholderia ubonensis TaxID=101571 RepID=UPI000F56DBAD|nr:glycosyltransferase family 1 protein [Burkholderia ubonensis]RQP42284.1 glycosyltransferase family 1 protein [Burkholderia ubonensis]RQP42539.1 glycosyltransferase family 1 protein [Burkholderia ubonensis]RQP45787.1 glycosyltransferase family 1 protein [Burkholderia ubonensis]RQP56150.1 glycosyltransferase family 1 protein [Burkholderia ubonensis]RQP63087.1 glycosyltransferase family 1 protein [Burkholderia ubonensis]
MRIVLDLQACQCGSRFRGIGRYSRSLGVAMARRLTDRGHEVWIALNAAFPEQIEPIASLFEDWVPRDRVSVFHVPAPIAALDSSNRWRLGAAELLRERALAELEPDLVHISTLIADGWSDDAVATIGELPVSVLTALTHYDLIPLVMQADYLSDGEFRSYYLKRLESLKKATLLLGISDYTCREAVQMLGREAGSVVNISSAVDALPPRSEDTELADRELLARLQINPGFLLYAPGGFDARKNLNRLIEAYALLPAHLRDRHQLVIASKIDQGMREAWQWKAQDCGLSPNQFVLTDYVPDDELMSLYRLSRAYVFPSLHEGFGLPVLEAMTVGAAVIASSRTGIPEAVGLDEALFDPTSNEDIARALLKVIEDDAFVARLREHAVQQVGRFSWTRCADVAIDAFEKVVAQYKSTNRQSASQESLPSLADIIRIASEKCGDCQPTEADLAMVRECFSLNSRTDK